jgi:D-glycero-alpha-D-manno-heptose-7-phosphate kinase
LESLHRIKALAREMYETVLARDLKHFGQLLHEGWENKKRVSSGISNRDLDRLYAIARNHGASGGKITGAGGGGFLLLFCEEEFQPAVRQAFAEEGIKEMRFGFDFQGCRVLVDDHFLDAEGNGVLQSCGAAVKAQNLIAGSGVARPQAEVGHRFSRMSADQKPV